MESREGRRQNSGPELQSSQRQRRFTERGARKQEIRNDERHGSQEAVSESLTPSSSRYSASSTRSSGSSRDSSKSSGKKVMLKYFIHEVRELRRQLDPDAKPLQRSRLSPRTGQSGFQDDALPDEVDHQMTNPGAVRPSPESFADGTRKRDSPLFEKNEDIARDGQQNRGSKDPKHKRKQPEPGKTRKDGGKVSEDACARDTPEKHRKRMGSKQARKPKDMHSYALPQENHGSAEDTSEKRRLGKSKHTRMPDADVALSGDFTGLTKAKEREDTKRPVLDTPDVPERISFVSVLGDQHASPSGSDKLQSALGARTRPKKVRDGPHRKDNKTEKQLLDLLLT